MRKSYFYIFLCSIFFLTGCEIVPHEDISDPLAISIANPNFVPIDDALNEMYSLLGAINSKTRSIASKSVKSVEVLGRESLSTSTRSSDLIPEQALYIVNFNEGGFALLAADNRYDPVLAITNEGKFSLSDFNKTSTTTKTQGLTLEDLYCAEDDEYYIGSDDPVDVISQFVQDYLSITDEGEELIIDPSQIITSYEYSDWIEYGSVPALLSTKWKQGYPFNSLCPTKDGTPLPAGCVAIAVMQIVAYHQTPPTTDYDSQTISGITKPHETSSSWAELIAGLDDDNKYSTAAFIARHIGHKCNTNYNFCWTGQSFSTPRRAKNAFEAAPLNYTNAYKYNSYNETKILEQLNASNPVFVAGISGNVDGHAWVIDGYIQRRQEKTAYYLDGSSGVVNTHAKTQKLVHCNWGWGGDCDGYYISGLFDLTNGAELVKEGDSNETEDCNFTWWFRTLTVNP